MPYSARNPPINPQKSNGGYPILVQPSVAYCAHMNTLDLTLPLSPDRRNFRPRRRRVSRARAHWWFQQNKKIISGNLAAYHGSTSHKDAKNPPTTPKPAHEKVPCPARYLRHGNDPVL